MTPTVFYAPTDLRWVDPRPTPAPSASDEDVVRELLGTRLSGDELSNALQALGLAPYKRAFNASGRDAWARRKTKWLELFDDAPNVWQANGTTPIDVKGDLWQRVAEGKRRD